MGATGGKESATMPLVPAATFKIPQQMRARLHLHLSLSSYGICLVMVLLSARTMYLETLRFFKTTLTVTATNAKTCNVCS